MSDLDDDEVKATRKLNGVDKTAVNKDLELIKTLIKEYKIDIKGVSYGKQFRLLRTIENLIDRVKELEEENESKGNKIWELKETIQDLENECISLHELIDEEM